MNIIEAVKSGRDFRRKNTDLWYSNNDSPYKITKEDLLAEDWELEVAPVVITREQFNAAWETVLRSSVDGVFDGEQLAKELGLAD